MHYYVAIQDNLIIWWKVKHNSLSIVIHERIRMNGHTWTAVVLPASHIAAVFISVSLVFGIWSITQDWCVSWFMTTATLIPLHTQTFINELLLEEREPLVSVKHTWVLLMSSLSAHTVVSLSALGHSPTPRFMLTRNTVEGCHCSTVRGENVLTARNHYLTLVSTAALMFLEEK